MMRDFSIVGTAMGASFSEIKKTGFIGLLCLVIGTVVAFFVGGTIGYFMGYTDAKSFATIGGGACTFIVGPITGGAVGASSEVIAISIAIGVIKSIVVTISTPFVAKRLGIAPQVPILLRNAISCFVSHANFSDFILDSSCFD